MEIHGVHWVCRAPITVPKVETAEILIRQCGHIVFQGSMLYNEFYDVITYHTEIEHNAEDCTRESDRPWFSGLS